SSALSSALPNSHQAAPSSMTPNGVRVDPQTRLRGAFFWLAMTVGEVRFCPPKRPGGDIAGTIALPPRRKWFPNGVISRRRERGFAQRAIEELSIRCSGSGDTLDLLSGGNQQKVVIGRW